MGFVTEGEIIGEISFVMGLVSGATVIADNECTVIALNTKNLEELLFDNPNLASAFYLFISKLVRKRLSRMQKSNLNHRQQS